MIMTDSTDVKLTVREAVNKANAGRAILLWQVIEQLSLSDGDADATGIGGPDKTCAVAYPDPQTEFIPVDGYA
jgi:hypothetical protein